MQSVVNGISSFLPWPWDGLPGWLAAVIHHLHSAAGTSLVSQSYVNGQLIIFFWLQAAVLAVPG